MDPDPTLAHWIGLEILTNLLFLKFEIPSTGSKVISQQSWVFFVQKSKFWADSIIKNKSNIVKMAEKLQFLTQKIGPHDKNIHNF